MHSIQNHSFFQVEYFVQRAIFGREVAPAWVSRQAAYGFEELSLLLAVY